MSDTRLLRSAAIGKRQLLANLAELVLIGKHQANGMGGLPIVGEPDAVAQQLANLSKAGLRGIGVSFVNYIDELPFFCAEVLPRLERMGLREQARVRLAN